MEKEIKLINREASIFIISEIEGAEISKIIDLYYQINDNSKGFQYKASEVTSLLGISTAELRKKLRSYKLDIKIIKSQRCELCKKSLQYVNLTRTDLSGFLISGRDSRKSWDFVLENTNYRKISVPSQLYMKYEHCNECILSNKTMPYSNQWNIFRQEQEEYQKKKDIEDAKQKYNIDLIRKEIKTLPKIPTGNKDVDKLLRGGFEVNGIHLIAGTSPSNSYSFLLGIVCDLIENGYKIKFLTHSKGEINVKNDILLRAGNMELHNLNSLDFYRSSKVVRIIEAFEQKSIEVLWGYNSTLEKLENLLWDNSCILIIDSIQELRTSEKNKNFLASRDEEFAESLKRLTSMVVEQNLTVIASSLTNRLIDNYKPISRHVGKERMPMLKDLRDSNTLEHFAKSIGYVYHPWETDGSKLKLPKFCLLKSSYSYNLNDCVVLDYDEETGYYSEIESSIPNYNLFRTEISDLVQC